MTTLKLRGKRLYDGETEVAEIRGFREFVRDQIHADFRVIVGGKDVARGFCYFRDAVKWAKDVVPGMITG